MHERIRPQPRLSTVGIPLDPTDVAAARARGAAVPVVHSLGARREDLTGAARRARAAAGFSSSQDHGAPGTTRETHLLNGGAADSMLVGGDGHRDVSTENPCVRHKFSPDTGTRQAVSASLRLPDDSGAFALDDAAPAQLIATATDDVAPAHLIAEARRSERFLGSMLCYLAFIAVVLLGAGDWLARLFLAWSWS
jgi:hypothetical protein